MGLLSYAGIATWLNLVKNTPFPEAGQVENFISEISYGFKPKLEIFVSNAQFSGEKLKTGVQEVLLIDSSVPAS